MQLEKKFIDFVNSQNLFSATDRLLVAVSGGVDSVLLCHLLHTLNYDFAIVHCNFSLRGKESDGDALLVKNLAISLGKTVYENTFDTNSYAEENKLSTQVAARELRYEYFEMLRRENNFDFILTAHHGSDNVETVTMNFFKGSGIRGLKGILPKQGKVIRPLLFATKEELIEHAEAIKLDYREDSSNASDKYTRNFFRNTILPQIEKVYPTAEQNVLSSIERFQDILEIYEESIAKTISGLKEANGTGWKVSVAKLRKTKPLATIVFELFASIGFTSAATPEIIKLLDAASGKYITNTTHRILVNRKWLLVNELQEEDSSFYLVETDMTTINFSLGQLIITQEKPSTEIDKNKDVALLHMDKVQFPLLLRKWKQGDYFYPLGMQKKKKLSRFFIDQKLSLADKENAWVLEAADKKIIWIVGMRIDDRFKITPSDTATVLKFRLIPSDQKG